MALKCDIFRGDSRLEQVAQNSPVMKYGERGDPVAKVQRGLLKLGFSLPNSTREGPPDGMFGSETRQAIIDYQRTSGLLSRLYVLSIFLGSYGFFACVLIAMIRW